MADKDYSATIDGFLAEQVVVPAVALIKLPNLILKNLTVRGIIVGSRRMFVDLIGAMVANNIKPVIDRVFDWDDVYDAIEYMQSGEKIGKIVIRVT